MRIDEVYHRGGTLWAVYNDLGDVQAYCSTQNRLKTLCRLSSLGKRRGCA
jgi:hypothetical protein